MDLSAADLFPWVPVNSPTLRYDLLPGFFFGLAQSNHRSTGYGA
jgi:hypothetical protein